MRTCTRACEKRESGKQPLGLGLGLVFKVGVRVRVKVVVTCGYYYLCIILIPAILGTFLLH